ncbi:MAG: L-seryl-tRNA(Sec) selenium transferase [Candidatus Promineifilaceae bacterium]
MSGEASQALWRQLPGVDKLLNLPASTPLIAQYGRDLTLEALRAVLDEQRRQIRDGHLRLMEPDAYAAAAADWLADLLAPSLRPVLNATGVIIHTNLGRAPLSQAALAAVQAAAGYSALEYDLEAGSRGSRFAHAEPLLRRLTGAEAACVVNNNAAAVLLMLSALCHGREVIISRGQLVEIGGGFRVPDVMAQSGCRLVEVGTTNRTHLRDYEMAIGDNTAAILAAHHSNYKIIGFSSEPTLAELAELAHRHNVPLLFDQGSGALLDTTACGLDPEPLVTDSLAAGVDLVAFSGDKLLGGPQAGILCGRADLVAKCRQHPLARAVRPDKLCLAALSATLTAYLTDRATRDIPVWRMISRPLAALAAQVEAWITALADVDARVESAPGFSTVGGGSLPGAQLPTQLLSIGDLSPHCLSMRLRRYDPPVIARIADDRLLLDPRTLLPGQEALLPAALRSCIAACRG